MISCFVVIDIQCSFCIVYIPLGTSSFFPYHGFGTCSENDISKITIGGIQFASNQLVEFLNCWRASIYYCLVLFPCLIHHFLHNPSRIHIHAHAFLCGIFHMVNNWSVIIIYDGLELFDKMAWENNNEIF